MMQYSPNNLLRMVKFVRRHFQRKVTQLLNNWIVHSNQMLSHIY